MKRYRIELDGKLIGTSLLEKADAPMGVVFGRIDFDPVELDYDFFFNYAFANQIFIVHDFPEERFIGIQNIPDLKIISEDGNEITGLGTSIEGSDSEGFEIYIIGIAYPFYEEEFPHHVKEYKERWK